MQEMMSNANGFQGSFTKNSNNNRNSGNRMNAGGNGGMKSDPNFAKATNKA